MSRNSTTDDDGTAATIFAFLASGARHGLTGSSRYYAWLGGLMLPILAGLATYFLQRQHGLVITSARHLNPWGTLTYAQFPFFDGIAAGGVVIFAIGYLYDREDAKQLADIGWALAVSGAIVSIASVLSMVGRLGRVPYLFPGIGTPNFPTSMLPWDMIVLNGFLFLVIFVPGYAQYRRFQGKQAPFWMTYGVYATVVMAIALQAVLAGIIVVNPARDIWFTALMVPRFISSAITAGGAVTILVLLVARRSLADPLERAGIAVTDRTLVLLGHVVALALILNLFGVLSEVFMLTWTDTAHGAIMEYLLFGLVQHGETYSMLTPLMRGSIVLELSALLLLVYPGTRKTIRTLAIASGAAVAGVFLEKGLILFLSAFIISPNGQVYEPSFTLPEVTMGVSLWALGALIFTVLLKAAIGIRSERTPS